MWPHWSLVNSLQKVLMYRYMCVLLIRRKGPSAAVEDVLLSFRFWNIWSARHSSIFLKATCGGCHEAGIPRSSIIQELQGSSGIQLNHTILCSVFNRIIILRTIPSSTLTWWFSMVHCPLVRFSTFNAVTNAYEPRSCTCLQWDKFA